MPPKAKSKNKAPGKGTQPDSINGLPEDNMSSEQMEERIMHLQKEIEGEIELRKYFQAEREKCIGLCDISKRRLEEAIAETKKFDTELGELEERHRSEIKVNKQKAKFLVAKHQNLISEVKSGCAASAEQIKKEQKDFEKELLEEMGALRVDVHDAFTENLQGLKAKHEREKTERRDRLEQELSEIRAKYEERFDLLQQEREQKRTRDVCELKDQKNRRVQSLMRHHEKTFTEYKADLKKLMDEYLESHNSLSLDIEQMKSKETEIKAGLSEISQDNERLGQDVQKVREEITKTEKKLKFCEKDKNLLATRKAVLKAEEKELKELKRENEALGEKFKELQVERDELSKMFPRNIQRMRREAVSKSTKLERKTGRRLDATEKLEA